MDVTEALDLVLKDNKNILEDCPLIGIKVKSPDGEITIEKIEECIKMTGYLVNDKYYLGYYKAAELLGGSL